MKMFKFIFPTVVSLAMLASCGEDASGDASGDASAEGTEQADACGPDCDKPCCDKEGKACDANCEKACCATAEGGEDMPTEETTEAPAVEEAH